MANEVVSVDITVAFKYIKKNTSFINKLIGWWTKSKYYHVELIIGSKWISSNPDKGGVTINDLRELNDNWHYCKLPKIEMTNDQVHTIMTWINSQSEKKYDWKAIFLCCVVPLNWHSKNKWFCSEIVTTILKFFLVNNVLNLTPNNVTPGKLAKILNFE